MTLRLMPLDIERYAEEYTTRETPVLAALNRETNMKTNQPVMLSGHLQGALLQMLSHMIKPKCILELGTFTGYSAICLAQGLQQGGKLHTIELDEELYDMATHYIKLAGLQDVVITHTGYATDIIPTLNETFDMVFIDADKVNYSLYYDMVFSKVPVGGYIIADNVLYEGDVLLPTTEQSKNARAIYEFNNKVKADDRIQRVLLPIRDGLMIMRKVGE